MFKEMRRKDRLLDNDEIYKILADNTYGVLGTVSVEGYPYGVPISYVFYNKAIYIHGATRGHKWENISFNNKVSFTVIGKTELLPDQFSTSFESVIAFGRAVDVSNEEKYEALLEFINKYSPDFLNEGKDYIDKAGKATKTMKIEIEHMTGKKK